MLKRSFYYTVLSFMSLISGFSLAFAAPQQPKVRPPHSQLELPRLTPGTQIDTSGSQTSAKKFNCNDLKKAVLKISVHASNYLNRNTTRTLTGNPYLKQYLQCSTSLLFCVVKTSTESKMVYAPAHPDANQDGYVKYPLINEASELAGLKNAAQEVRMLASLGVCETQALQMGQTIFIKYRTGFDVANDTLSFDEQGNLKSWSRISKEGQAQDFALSPDGKILNL